MSRRTRLTDEERLYLISLVESDNNLTTNNMKMALIGRPIKRLLEKLGDTTYHGSKSRIINFKEKACPYCERVLQSGAGLSRHVSSAHKNPPNNTTTRSGE